MNKKHSRIKYNQIMQKFGVLIILLGISAIVSILSPNFLTPKNLINVVRQISIVAIVGFGVTMVIITTGIDLSSGSIIAVSSVVTALLMVELHIPVYLALLVSLGIGAVCGSINGVLVAFARIPPFVATLGMMISLRGVALMISNGRPITGFPDEFNYIGRGDLFGIPFILYIFVIVALLSHYLLQHTKYGRYIYAIGGNEQAAKVSGVNVRKNLVIVYAYAGVLSALAGILLTSRISSGQPTAGGGYEMDAIAGAVIGGVSLAGGIGTIIGTILGALIIGVLNNGLELLRVSPYMQQVLKGAIIIAAVIFDQIKNKR